MYTQKAFSSKVDVAVWTSRSPTELKDTNIGIVMMKWTAKTKRNLCRKIEWDNNQR